MKAIILPLLYLVTTAVASPKCHSCFFGVCYQRSKLFKTSEISGQLAIDRAESIVYFHYAKEGIDHTGLYNINDATYYDIPGPSYTFARTVDQNSRTTYMSSTKGIYKYVPSTNTTELHGLPDKTIWQMQFNNKLYFTVFSVAGLNVFENGKVSSIPALSSHKIDDFVIDKVGDVYFVSNLQLYRLKKNARKAVKFSDEMYSLSTDKNGNVYFSHAGTGGIYNLDYNRDRIIDVGAFGPGTPLKFVFDSSNNVIYHDADEDALYYLLPRYGRCKVTTKKTGTASRLTVTPTDIEDDE